MKKSTSITLLLIVTISVAASHIGWAARDNGTLLVLDRREFDVAGIASDHWTKMIRNCNGVVRLQPVDENYQTTARLIRDYSPPHSESVRLSSVWSSDNWVLAEAEFVDLLPAVVLLDFSGGEPKIVSNAVWSGYTKPWESAPFIRDYMLRQVPNLSPSLASCFDPQSLSFR